MNQLVAANKYPDLGKPTIKDRVLNLRLGGLGGGRYFAGTTVKAMVRRVSELNFRGFEVIVDLLGEEGNGCGTKQDKADRTLAVARVISELGLKAQIAIRPGQFDYDYRLLERLARAIVDDTGVFIWVDIEKRTTLEPTKNAYKHLAIERPGKVGLALQSYYVDAPNHRDELIEFAFVNGVPIHIRTVRGVYVDESDFKTIAEMHAQLAEDTYILATSKVRGVHVHLGSHEPLQLALAARLHRDCPEAMKEAQVLLGVNSEHAYSTIAKEGKIPVRIYVPFGPTTYKYIRRRLEEAGGTVKGLLGARLGETRTLQIFRYGIYEAAHDPTNPKHPFIEVAAGEKNWPMVKVWINGYV